MLDLKSDCECAIRQSATDDPVLGANNVLGHVAAKNPENPCANFKVYLDTMAGYCANMTGEK